MVFVPEALPPDFAAPSVQVRNAGGEEEKADEESFFPSAGLLKPRRNDRDEQVDAYQWIHEPEMART